MEEERDRLEADLYRLAEFANLESFVAELTRVAFYSGIEPGTLDIIAWYKSEERRIFGEENV